MKYLSNSVEKTIKLGERIGQRLTGGEFITLVGDLGGGKTHFVKGLGQGLDITDEITSPTFVIERIYKTSRDLELHHFDFYRLGSFDREIKAKVDDLSSDQKNIVVIEWAKNMPEALPKEYLQIDFEYVDDTTRKIILTTFGSHYEKLAKEIQ